MHPGPDGVLDLGVPRAETLAWTLLLVVVAAAGLADLRRGSGAVAIACLVVVVLLLGCLVPPAVGRVQLHPEGHLTVRSLLGTVRYEMEQIDSVVVDVGGPALEGPWSHRDGSGAVGLLRGASLVLFGGEDVPLPSTQVLPVPALRRRLDRQVTALQAWLAEGPA